MFWKNLLLLGALLLATIPLQAQINTKQLSAPPPDIFRAVSVKSASPIIREEISEYGLLETDPETYAQLLAAAPDEWTLDIPATELAPKGLHLKLHRNNPLQMGLKLRLASTGSFVDKVNLGHHYVGEIVGEPGSRVALSLLDTEMRATIERTAGERLALGVDRQQAKSATKLTYLLFPDRQLLDRQELDCATPDSGVPYSDKELKPIGQGKSAGGCVDIYFEVDYDIYLDKGGANAAAQHVTANFNEVNVLYQAIGVNLKISEILVWDQPSPYAGSSSSTILTQFQSTRRSFNGDLAQLLSYKASGGIAVLDGLCHPYNAARMSFSSIRSGFAAVPTFSWSTMVIAHELGHLLGSQHTHACVWNGNNTAIDSCPGWTEGSCPNPGNPSNGGTIMSYCHLRSTGINFLNGFGPQPTAVIQNRVAAAQNCVQAVCSVVGDGGNDDDDDNPDDPNPGGNDETTCEAQTVYLDLTLDDFGMETTWSLRSESGGLVAKGGPYAKKQKGKVIKDTICVPDGCYVFEIKDSDFDGICCAYGNGSFSLRDSSGTVLGGNNTFDTLAIVDFCLPDVPPNDNEECTALNFNNEPVLSYGSNQDAGTFTVLENGKMLLLEDNSWKKIDLDYTITSDTWLSFWFRSTQQGEVHGIGFDDNDIISSNLTFKLYGTQNWGRQEFTDYPGNGSWKFYQIPVGRYYVGDAINLFFVADHDVGARNGNSYFRSVTISEGMPCRPNREDEALGLVAPDQELQLHPNPAADRVHIALPATAAGATYRVVDLTGRTLRSGEVTGPTLDIMVSDLPAGAYVFHYHNGEQGGSRRFTVAK